MGPLSSLGRTNPEVDFPYLTSVEDERYITNVKDGDLIGYKYINLADTKKVSVSYLSDGEGKLEIYTENGRQKEEINLPKTDKWTWADAKTAFTEEKELYFVYKGTGSISLLTLRLEA